MVAPEIAWSQRRALFSSIPWARGLDLPLASIWALGARNETLGETLGLTRQAGVTRLAGLNRSPVAQSVERMTVNH